jgi:hypothetical protein
VPVIVTPADTKKGRRPVLAREAAAEVGTRLGQGGDGETEASTVARVAGHDRSVTTQPANDDRKPATVAATSRKQLKLLREDALAATTEPNDPGEATARLDAFLARMIRPGGALPPKEPGE